MSSEIQNVLEGHRALLDEAAAAGARLGTLEEQARAWDALGYRADDVEFWMARRCASPRASAALGSAAIDGVAAAATTEFGEGPPDTIAFKLSAGQITLADALALTGISTLLISDEQALALDDHLEATRATINKLRETSQQLSELAQTPVYPSIGNDVIYAITRGLSDSAYALQGLAAQTLQGQADYLAWDRERAATEPHGVRELADRVTAFADKLQALAGEGQELFFGRHDWNPSGWSIRITMHDGQEIHDRVDELRRTRRDDQPTRD